MATSSPAAVHSTMTPQGLRLLGACRRNLELLRDLEKSAPGDVAIITSALVNHIRSAWPSETMTLPSVEMPAIVSPAVPMFIYEPAEEIAAQLHDGAEYIVSMFRDRLAPDCIGLSIRDALDGHALLYMTPEQVETLRQGLARVLASVRK